jgi:hypothetical protein
VSLSRIVANAAPKGKADANSKKTVVVIAKITDDTRYDDYLEFLHDAFY